MPASFYGGSATIYQFPVGGRAGLLDRRDPRQPVADLVKITNGSSWYHEEAVRESDLPRKN